jgi:carboxymethylenebutenolidase
MCHDDSSRPPAPPRHEATDETSFVTLVSADGNAFSAAITRPTRSATAGVVILPDIRGLHPYYVALTERFAEAGIAAVAIDYFGRTAGVPDGGIRGEDFDWQTHIPQTSPEGIDADISAAMGYLRDVVTADLPVIVVGFCFGGSHAWRQSGGSLDLAGCVGFYGRPAMVGEAAQHAAEPVVMLIAGADAATPVADQHVLAETMRAAGADVDEAVYDGAPHSFFDRAFAEWADACNDAWRRILALTDRVSLG